MRHVATTLGLPTLLLALTLLGAAPVLLAATADDAVQAGDPDDSARAVAYWRLWLTLRPRLSDVSVPLAERIEALNAFLAHSPDAPWAEQPKAEGARLLEALVAEWRGANTTPASSALPATSGTRAESWDVGRYDPDEEALREEVRARTMLRPGGNARRTLFDVLRLSYSAPFGFEGALGRVRWSTFQMEVVAGGGEWGGLFTNGQFWAGLFGIGARFPFGDDRTNEIGFLVFPLAFDLYGAHTFDDEYDPDLGLGFVHTRLYYRHDFENVAIEAAVSTPLVFGADDLFDGPPPLLLSVGLALGRTR